MSDGDDRPRRPDTSRALAEDAHILFEARRILEARFTSGKHDGTARAVRTAATELISRSRHPSRQLRPFSDLDRAALKDATIQQAVADAQLDQAERQHGAHTRKPGTET